MKNIKKIANKILANYNKTAGRVKEKLMDVTEEVIQHIKTPNNEDKLHDEIMEWLMDGNMDSIELREGPHSIAESFVKDKKRYKLAQMNGKHLFHFGASSPDGDTRYA